MVCLGEKLLQMAVEHFHNPSSLVFRAVDEGCKDKSCSESRLALQPAI
jgi:hypothetical protein